MNVFKKKTICAAVLASLGAMGVAGSASAVQLSQDGTGSVLIYPYYTVRTAGNGEYNTYVNVTNTTNRAKVVKVRFLEGKNSREVLDFNLWLSPHDVWTGAIVATATGATLNSGDNSCVSTRGGVTLSKAAGVSFDFSNVAYASGAVSATNVSGVDGADTSLDRVREGYIEIIEMGVIDNAVANLDGVALQAAITHNASGVPANCAVIPVAGATTALGDYNGDGASTAVMLTGTGGLTGGASLINVSNGSDFGYDPVVLEEFAAAPLFYAPGSINPDLNNAFPTSNIFYYHETAVAGTFATNTVFSDFNVAAPNGLEGVDAVSSVLMRTSVMNSYVMEATTLSKTDWVTTFPTKRFYIQPAAFNTTGNNNIRPFGTSYTEFGATGSCGAFSLTSYDREEQSVGTSTTEVSPPVPGAPADSLCWESTVLNFHAVGVTPTPAQTLLGSTNGRGVAVPYVNGWANLEFGTWAGAAFTAAYTPLVEETVATTYSHRGLPVIGFMAQDFINNNVTINALPSASSYGGNFNHKYTRLITGGAITNIATNPYMP